MYQLYAGNQERTSLSWIQLGQDVDGDNPDDLFGSSVALSADGKILTVGAPDEMGKSSGYVGEFTTWREMVSVQAGDSLAKTSTAKRLVIVLKWLFLFLGMVSYLLLAPALRMEIHQVESRFIRGEIMIRPGHSLELTFMENHPMIIWDGLCLFQLMAILS